MRHRPEAPPPTASRSSSFARAGRARPRPHHDPPPRPHGKLPVGQIARPPPESRRRRLSRGPPRRLRPFCERPERDTAHRLRWPAPCRHGPATRSMSRPKCAFTIRPTSTAPTAVRRATSPAVSREKACRIDEEQDSAEPLCPRDGARGAGAHQRGHEARRWQADRAGSRFGVSFIPPPSRRCQGLAFALQEASPSWRPRGPRSAASLISGTRLARRRSRSESKTKRASGRRGHHCRRRGLPGQEGQFAHERYPRRCRPRAPQIVTAACPSAR